MPMVDLHFLVLGSTLPTDHGYELYAALAHAVDWLHDRNARVFIAPITGTYTSNGQIQIEPRRSRLRLRLPLDNLTTVLRLAGKAFNLSGRTIRLGVPRVQALQPASALIARMVTIKGFTEPKPFLEGARRQLQELEIEGEPGIPSITAGNHAGKPRRRILRVKEQRIVGFSLQVVGLTAEESIRLQEHGVGGRARMGCGFFVPMREAQQ
jgi:CRISPR-associated protein Cas6